MCCADFHFDTTDSMHGIIHILPKLFVWGLDCQCMSLSILSPSQRPTMASHTPAHIQWLELYYRHFFSVLELWAYQRNLGMICYFAAFFEAGWVLRGSTGFCILTLVLN